MRIVIAEDAAIERLLLQRAVEDLGHECLVAADGAEAWRLVQAYAPQVVISDWVMPGLDGADLCRRVRAQRDSPYVYFILLTMLDHRGFALEGMQAGADDYLAKPLNGEELRLRLIAAERVTTLHAALAEAHRLQGQLDGITLAGRELAHVLNNELALAVSALELLRLDPAAAVDSPELFAEAAVHLDRAVAHVAKLQRVVRVETQETPVGPALDLERST